MKTFNGITYNEEFVHNYLNDSSHEKLRNTLKYFFSNEDVKKDLESNNFDKVFNNWDYNFSYLNEGFKMFICCLLEAEIPFLSYLTHIPRYCFDYCIFIKKIEIPSNIGSIGNRAFIESYISEIIIKPREKDKPLKLLHDDVFEKSCEIIYEGTKAECETSIVNEGTVTYTIKCSDMYMLC